MSKIIPTHKAFVLWLFFLVFGGILWVLSLRMLPFCLSRYIIAIHVAFFFFWPSRLNVAVRPVGCGSVPLFLKSGCSRWSFEMFPNQKNCSRSGNPSKNRCLCQTYLRIGGLKGLFCLFVHIRTAAVILFSTNRLFHPFLVLSEASRENFFSLFFT